MTDPLAKEIIAAKHNEGENAYLWVCPTDAILWANEEDGLNDDGDRAVARWSIEEPTVEALINSGECDDIAC